MGNSTEKQTASGFRVIKVFPNSPAKQAGLVDFLDFIIEVQSPVDNTPLTENYNDFYRLISKSENQNLVLKVYNALSRSIRTINLVPNRDWEGADSLLGALIRYEEYTRAHEKALRIGKVYPNSPASAAGLTADYDYILGTPQYMYNDLNALANFIEMTQEQSAIKSLEICVYSSLNNQVRSTLLIPNKNWGGDGYIGCVFALGLLNYLPHVDAELIETTKNIEKKQEEEVEKSTSDKSDSEIANPPAKETHPVQENLKPPTDAELLQANIPKRENSSELELSQEAAQHRMKILKSSGKKTPVTKSVSKPFMQGGNSRANPFFNENPEDGNTQPKSSESLKEESNDKPTNLKSQGSIESPLTSPINPPKETSFEEKQPPEESKEIAAPSNEDPNKSSSSDKKLEENSIRINAAGTEYRYFSKKLNGDYVILTSDLFNLEEMKFIR